MSCLGSRIQFLPLVLVISGWCLPVACRPCMPPIPVQALWWAIVSIWIHQIEKTSWEHELRAYYICLIEIEIPAVCPHYQAAQWSPHMGLHLLSFSFYAPSSPIATQSTGFWALATAVFQNLFDLHFGRSYHRLCIRNSGEGARICVYWSRRCRPTSHTACISSCV